MTVGKHRGSTCPQVGPCSSAPGQAQGRVGGSAAEGIELLYWVLLVAQT